jgi:hypothetical protein
MIDRSASYWQTDRAPFAKEMKADLSNIGGPGADNWVAAHCLFLAILARLDCQQ